MRMSREANNGGPPPTMPLAAVVPPCFAQAALSSDALVHPHTDESPPAAPPPSAVGYSPRGRALLAGSGRLLSASVALHFPRRPRGDPGMMDTMATQYGALVHGRRVDKDVAASVEARSVAGGQVVALIALPCPRRDGGCARPLSPASTISCSRRSRSRSPSDHHWPRSGILARS